MPQYIQTSGRKEGNVLINDALNTFYLRLYGVRHMVKDHSDSEKGTRCRHIGYSFRLAARVLLYAPSHRQDSTYHGLLNLGRVLHIKTNGPGHCLFVYLFRLLKRDLIKELVYD